MIAVVGAVVASAAVAHAFDAAVVAVADVVAAAGTVESAHPRNCVVAAAAAVAVSLSRPFAHQRQHVAPRQFHHSEGGGGSVSYFVRVEQLR